MSVEKKSYLPEFRFSEFKNDGEWTVKVLDDIVFVNSGKDYKHLGLGNIPVYGTGGYMLSVDDKLSEIDAVGIGRKGTIDKPQYLKAPFWTVDTLFFLTNKEGYDIQFLFYLSQTIDWKKYSEQGVLPSLSKSTIESIKVVIPNSLNDSIAEQKKVAHCLSSLDDCIEATNHKLRLLKEYKRGLMQRLFPNKGKTVPDLRFPEFQDAGAWNITKNDCVIETLTPPKKLSSSEYKANGKYPIVDQSATFIAGYSDDETAVVRNEYNDYVVFGDHTCILKRVNFSFIQGADGVKIFTSRFSDLLTLYIYQYMCAHPIISKEYKRHFTDLREQEFMYPKKKEEQEKIAQCLLSIDEFIQAYENKASTMEQHKKALMQQLFPQL